jgi:hypothetical protein
LSDQRSPLVQFTLHSLMIAVAVAAVILYLARVFGDRLFFGLLPVLAALMGRFSRTLKPPDHRFTAREKITVGLSCLAAPSPRAALKLVWMMGPAASTGEHVQGFVILAAAGVAPWAIFLFSTWLLRVVATSMVESLPNRLIKFLLRQTGIVYDIELEEGAAEAVDL